MEFSEIFELNRLAKQGNKDLKLSKIQQLRTVPKISRFSQEIQRDRTTQLIDFNFKGHTEKNSERTRKFFIEKDFSYLQPRKDKPRSSLTLSLLQPEEDQKKPLNSQIVIKIYFFHSPHYLNLVLPQEINVVDMLKKALVSYTKHFKSSLPYGLDTSAYQVWLPNEESNMPDPDFPISKDRKVNSLNTKTLCVCEKPSYTCPTRAKTSKMVQILSNKDKLILKVFYKGSWTHIQVSPFSKLQDLLPVIQKKFFIPGRVCESLYEFKVFIEETGEYCSVDMNLFVQDLRTSDISLNVKKYADC